DRLSQQGQFTDRYGKAIEQLGDSDSIEVRLGGTYALERLMRDSKDDQPTIVEMLAGYVRGRARAPAARNPGPATDVQAAPTARGRRTPVDDETHIDLEGAHLEDARFCRRGLGTARQARAWLWCSSSARRRCRAAFAMVEAG